MNNRLEIIQAILSSGKVRSQDELASILASRGITVAQATLSRDLKKLRVVKRPDPDGGSCYELPGQSSLPGLPSERHVGESIVSVEFSGQMGVVKTLPGCAGMVGALVDGHSHPGVMGTIAGDDILLLLLREGAPHDEVMSFIGGIIPGLDGKIIQ
ncbi:MAG: hypothetical protein K6G79_08020 [Bacteroidales bacterium]|nr:hypothetical protein [Bacteroidales bacterium]